MPFIIIVFIAALLIEGLGTTLSVIGLALLFNGNPLIFAMAIALDVGKVVSVSFLYRNWKKVNFLMKTYMTIAALTLILITSAGVFGYLSAEFQKAIQGTSENVVLVEAMEDEKSRLQARKVEIDSQIAAIPPDFVTGRRQAIEAFADEVQRINARLIVIDSELPTLKLDTIKKEVEVGPIIYVAEAFETTPEVAVKYIIMVIIFVFDPLAIVLLIAGNFLLMERKRDKLGLTKEGKPSLADSFGNNWGLPTDQSRAEKPVEASAAESQPPAKDPVSVAQAITTSEIEPDEPDESDNDREVITKDRLIHYPIRSSLDTVSASSDVFPDDSYTGKYDKLYRS